MRTIKRAVHIDFHTMPDIPDFGERFDAVQFARTLADARVDFINFFAKCNIGFAYYPTKIGIPHPHLKFDMLGQVVEECRKLGIGVTAYFNVGLDHEMARKRRDWTVVNEDGQIIYGDRTANFFRNMCYHSGYRDYMLAMIREVLERYPVEGVFLDCMAVRPCHGNECLETMREKGMDPLDPGQVREFAREALLEFCRDVKKLVGDDKFLYLNGLSTQETKGLRTHWEIECLPGAWSYDFFPAQAAYIRNLGQQVFYMTGRFHANWGDFGGLKSKASLQNDCWDAIMNAMPTSVGDHMHPRDGLDEPVYRMIGDIYRDIERYEPWTDEAAAVADVAVLTRTDGHLHGCHAGAVRMLGELKLTYDIIDEEMEFDRYNLLIMPDQITVTPALRAKLKAHLSAGKGIISSGHSGLDEAHTGFAMEEWQLSYEGKDASNASYFRIKENAGDDIPDMPCSMYGTGIRMKLGEGSRTIADYVQPYFNRRWDGFHGSFYTPPEKENGEPAVARCGNIIHFCFPVFGNYNRHAYPVHKYAVKHCIDQLLAQPVIRCERIPTTARVTVTAKERNRMIHIKLTYPEKRGSYEVIEDRPVLHGAAVSLRADGVTAVYMAPDRTPLPFDRTPDGYVRIALPSIEGYAMIVAETAL
ncbi:family 10 glycosylhydrolase [Paenibacillus oceani]|uniref:Family 10 glycosylhydrolase n=1 Tax=Paenibacillus oceani TaxID=2772510 RepID=A0A927CAD3_9BACL|nr:family 10 glycosylhydrolase [Paenibacillus oceani]MBD2863082.1 family 10 glycosylhydrolase [Paenibacillus oceani]